MFFKCPTLFPLVIGTLLVSWSYDSFADELGGPESLTVLRDSWRRAVERATDPIDQKYRRELELLLTGFTKSGRLDDALAVKKEIELLAVRDFRFSGKWKVIVKGGSYNDIREVTEDHVVGHDGNRGSFLINGNSIVIRFQGGYSETLTIDPDNLAVIEGKGSNGKQMVYTRISE